MMVQKLLERLRKAVNRRRQAQNLKMVVKILRCRTLNVRKPLHKKPCIRTKPQGMMHGDGPPFLPSWPAFNPQYQQSVSGLKPASSAASPAALPPKLYPPYPSSGLDAHLSDWYNGAIGRHLGLEAAYPPTHHGANGYPAPKADAMDTRYKLPEVGSSGQHPHLAQPSINHHASKSAGLTEVFMSHGQDLGRVEDHGRLLSNSHGKVNGYLSGDRAGHQQAPGSGYPFLYPGTSGFPAEQKYGSSRNQTEPPPSYEESLFNAKKVSDQSVKGLDLTHHGSQNAHSSSDGVPFLNSTSASTMPITSSADKHMISYYLPGEKTAHRDLPHDDLHANTDKARRVAAEIMGEAHFSMARKMAPEQLHSTEPSPFTNISNMFGMDPRRQQQQQQQQQQNKPSYETPEQHGQLSRPQSNQSSHSLDMPQANTRQENAGFGNKNQNVFNPVTSGAPDFWSQFGLPPPNVVAASQSSHLPSPQDLQRPQSVKTTSEQEKGNYRDKLESNPAPVYSRPESTGYDRPEINVKTADKKRVEKPRRRNSPEERVTDEQVNAKVQQILAALREEQLAHTKQQLATSVSYGHNMQQANHPQATRTDNKNEHITTKPQVSMQNNTQWNSAMSANVRYAGQTAPVTNSQSVLSNKDYHMSAEANKFCVSDVSHSRPQSADIRHIPHQPDIRQNNVNGFHGHAPIPLSQQVNDVREFKKDGRQSPCCENCARLGVRFSHHCQNHIKQNKFDPYAFSDEMEIYKERDKYRSVVQKSQSMKPPFKFMSDFEKTGHPGMQSKPALQNHLKSENIDVGYAMDDKVTLKKELVNQVNRSQGFTTSQKLGSKVLNKYKSPALSYYKKTKYQQNKVPGPKKYQPKIKVVANGKKAIIGKSEEEFQKNLMKNLGFPPLTPEDLILKRQTKLPSHCLNDRGTIASSVLSTEKNDSRAEVPLASHGPGVKHEASNSVPQLGSLPIKQEDGEPSLKKQVSDDIHLYGSRSVHPNDFKEPIRRSRSCEDLCKEQSAHHFEGLDMKGMVDNKQYESVPEQNANMASVSHHIEGLQKLVTGEKNHLASNTVIEVPKCSCLGPDYVFNESVEGPYYTHLGAGRSVDAVRKMLEKRLGVRGKAIRIEKVRYTGKEGKSSKGCPIAKWIIRRSSLEEKYLTILRHRQDHYCETAWLIIGLVAWEGVPRQQADDLYEFLSDDLPENGFETERRCGTNEQKMCACQGADLVKRGASFSFGCSWSMYFNACKYARSQTVRKFKLKDTSLEAGLEDKLQDLATCVGPLYEQCAPVAHSNQSLFSTTAQDCRLGKEKGGPFSGVTACVDFCAHSHRDTHNMNNGSTVVVTLTRHRGLSKPDDEQLHVLPMYVMEPTDESGSYDGHFDKIQNGALEVLHHYPLEARIRSHPLVSCKKRRQQNAKGPGRPGRKKKASTVNTGRQSPWGSSSSCQSTPKKTKWDASTLTYSQDSNQSFSSQPGSLGGTPVKKTGGSGNMTLGSDGDRPISYEELMSMSTEAGFEGLYNKFWNFFYTYGAFPPAAVIRGQVKNGQVGNAGNNNNNTSVANNINGQAQQHPDLRAVKQADMSYNVANKNYGSNVVPFEQNSGAALEKTPDIPHVARDTVHLTDPFSDRIPQPMSTTPSSTQMAASGTSSQADSRPGTNPGLESRQLPQNGAMDLSSHSSENISNSFTHSHLTASSSTQQPNTQENFIRPGRPATDSTTPSSTSIASSTSEKKTSKSPLDLLSMAVEMRTKDVGFSYAMPNTADNGMITGQDVHYQGKFTTEQMAGHSEQARPASVHSADAAFKMPATNTGDRHVGQTPANLEKQPNSFADGHHPSKVDGQSMSYPHSHRQPQQYQGNQENLFSGNMDINHQTQSFHQSNSGNCDSNNVNKNIHPNHNHSNQHVNHEGFDFSRSYHGSNIQALNTGQGQVPPGEHPAKNQFEQGYPGFENFMNQEKASCVPDPDVVRCQMEYNEEAFRDPNIGGVAIALSHGAVLFEVAKRELHATTGLKKPNRYNPTRISLVFYQHKNLNYERHGMYAYQKKLENMKKQKMEKMKAECGYVDIKEIENSFKGGKKRKFMEDEKPVEDEEYDILKSSASKYRYLWDCSAKRNEAFTTNTMSQKWISPQPMVTGPYQKWV